MSTCKSNDILNSICADLLSRPLDQAGIPVKTPLLPQDPHKNQDLPSRSVLGVKHPPQDISFKTRPCISLPDLTQLKLTSHFPYLRGHGRRSSSKFQRFQ